MDAEREGRLVIGDWIMGIGSKGGDGPATLLTRFAEELRRAIALLRSVSAGSLSFAGLVPCCGEVGSGLNF